jgi:hypothetical protein
VPEINSRQMIVALVDTLAALGNLARPSAGSTACALFAHEADTSIAPRLPDGLPGAYSVIRQWDGTRIGPTPTNVSLQCTTWAGTESAAIERAELLFNLLLDDRQLPRRDWAVGTPSTFLIVGVRHLMPWRSLGPTQTNMHEVAFNFETAYRPA